MAKHDPDSSPRQIRETPKGRRIEQQLLREAFSAQSEVSGNDVHRAQREMEREQGEEMEAKENMTNNARVGRYKKRQQPRE